MELKLGDIESHVHTGLWTDWSRGPVMGRTLTLTRGQGNLVIASTASFIAFVAARFWRIVCMVCHRWCFSTTEPRPTLHHQRQVILRNSGSPEAAAWSLIGLGIAWWGVDGVSRRLVLAGLSPLVSITVVVWAAFTLAGGFSSHLASEGGTTVLLDSYDCGYLDPSSSYGPQADPVMYRELLQTATNAEKYASQCYSSEPSVGLIDCGRLVRPRIRFNVNHNASCPFDAEICRSSDNNIHMDTGLVHLEALGLNSRPHQRTATRHVSHCAPLITKGYTSQRVVANTTLVRYHYGQYLKNNGSSSLQEMPYTYQVEDVAGQYRTNRYPGSLDSRSDGFQVSRVVATTVDRKTKRLPFSFVPLPKMSRTDADLKLYFLSGNGVYFREPLHDDWYRGTMPGPDLWVQGTNQTVKTYLPEEAASPIACAVQFQICNLSGGEDADQELCGPLASLSDALSEAAPLFNYTKEAMASGKKPPADNEDALRFFWVSTLMSTGPVNYLTQLASLPGPSLASQPYLTQGILYPMLPTGGIPLWHLDAERGLNIALAALQADFVFRVLGLADSEADSLRTRVAPSEKYLRELCDSQMVKSTRHTSFSLFGLSFTYALGCFFTLICATFMPVLNYLYKRTGRHGDARQVEWVLNNSLQLQRLAHEELGCGEWVRCTDDIPITTSSDTQLATLDLGDREHPRLIHIPAEKLEEA